MLTNLINFYVLRELLFASSGVCVPSRLFFLALTHFSQEKAHAQKRENGWGVSTTGLGLSRFGQRANGNQCLLGRARPAAANI